MSIKESCNTMEIWLSEVSINNDHEIDQTKKLKMILLNLKIVCADKKEVTPIADELAKIIAEMHDSTSILVTKGRTELRAAFREINEYVEEKEVDK